MGPFLSEQEKTVIPWPLLLIFIKNEEHYFNEIIKLKLASDIVHNLIIIFKLLILK